MLVGASNEVMHLMCVAIDTKFSAKYFELQREIALSGVDAMNKQIDQALDDVIDEYKRKSVSHKIFNGPGPRVDQFVMKDGSVVYCKTTVTDGGRAVDCD